MDRQQQEQERVTREAAEDRAGREAVEKEAARFATEVAAVSGVGGKQRVGERGVCTGGGGGLEIVEEVEEVGRFAIEVAVVRRMRDSSRCGSVVDAREAAEDRAGRVAVAGTWCALHRHALEDVHR